MSHQWEQTAADAKDLYGKYEDCLASDGIETAADADMALRGTMKGQHLNQKI